MLHSGPNNWKVKRHQCQTRTSSISGEHSRKHERGPFRDQEVSDPQTQRSRQDKSISSSESGETDYPQSRCNDWSPPRDHQQGSHTASQIVTELTACKEEGRDSSAERVEDWQSQCQNDPGKGQVGNLGLALTGQGWESPRRHR